MNTKCFLGLFLSSLVALSLGCARTSELERIDSFKRSGEEFFPRRMSLVVDNAGDLYGDEHAWFQDIKFLLESDLGLITELCEEGTDRCDGTIRLSIDLAPNDDRGAIDPRAAALSVFLWGLLPPLTWVVDDVQIDSELIVGVGIDRDRRPAESADIDMPSFQTRLLERHSFVSWAALGAFFAPAFIFDDGDPEFVQESLAERVRFEVAMKIARRLREDLAEDPLVERLAVESSQGRLALRVKGGPELIKLELLGIENARPIYFDVGAPAPKSPRDPIYLPDGLDGLLRVRATDGAKREEHYTIRVAVPGS